VVDAHSLESKQIQELQFPNPKNLTNFGLIDSNGRCSLGKKADMGTPICKP
jgi:hypothetical protein